MMLFAGLQLRDELVWRLRAEVERLRRQLWGVEAPAPRPPEVHRIHICTACGQIVWPDEPLPDREAQALDAARVADAAVALKIARGDIISEADVRHCSRGFVAALMSGAGLAEKRATARSSAKRLARRRAA